MQITKEGNSHPCIAAYINIYIYQYVECHLLILLMPLVDSWCIICHIAWEGQVE